MSNWKIIVSGSTKDFATDYNFTIQQGIGAGMGPVANVAQQYHTLDGDVYQRTIVKPKTFTLTGAFAGSSLADLHVLRKNLLNVLKFDRSSSPNDPVILQYVGGACTLQASVFYDGGLELGNVYHWSEPNVQLKFFQPDPYWETASQSASLATGASLSACNILARINGTWSNLGGVNNDIYTIVASGTDTFYAGGNFTSCSGTAASYLAKYSGSWFASSAFDSTVYSLTWVGSTLWAGGAFHNIGACTASHLGKMDGTVWTSPGSTNDDVNAICYGTDGWVYAGGGFTSIGGVSACRIARYNGTNWSASEFGNGVDDFIYSLAAAPDGSIYIGGAFQNVSGSAITNVIRWKSGSYFTLTSSGITGSVLSIQVNRDGTVYLGGDFSKAGNITACNIVGWDGANFFPLSSTGLSGCVNGMTLANDNITYMGGEFWKSDSNNLLNRVAKYSGTWSNLDVELAGSPIVYSVAIGASRSSTVGDYNIYIGGGGAFTTASVGSATTITTTTKCYPVIKIANTAGSIGTFYGFRNDTNGTGIYADLNLLAGETITFDFRPGHKTACSNYRGNVLYLLSDNSNFTRFCLESGSNRLNYLVSSQGTSTFGGSVIWTERYKSFDS